MIDRGCVGLVERVDLDGYFCGRTEEGAFGYWSSGGEQALLGKFRWSDELYTSESVMSLVSRYRE